MAKPASRQEFKDNCLRRLGHPVIQIEVSEEQIDDRVDEALEYYKDYHFDGSTLQYYKHLVTAENRPGVVNTIDITAGGSGYTNTDVVTVNGVGRDATVEIITDDDGVIVDTTVTNPGKGYAMAPTLSIASGSGSGAELTAITGGFIPVPENIMGAIQLFPVGSALGTNDIFNIRYQIALNDLYTLTSSSLVPYYSAFQHIEMIQELLVGRQPIRYNRHQDRIYVDMDWTIVPNGSYLMVEAYEVVDPNVYTDVWNDRWLLRYATALIKRQWGQHLTKYTGMAMPGSLTFDGNRILDDAQKEIDQLEADMIRDYSIPSQYFVG